MHWLYLIIFFLITGSSNATTITGRWTRHYDHNNGGINDNVYMISQDGEGIIWFSTYGGLYSYDGNRFVCHKDSLPARTRKGYHWMPETPLERQIYNGRKAGDKERFLCSMYDKDGNLWIGRTDGLWLYGNMTYPFMIEVIGEEVLCLHQDSRLRVWMTTREGTVALLDNNLKPVRYLSKDGEWKRERVRCGHVVTGIQEDKKGRIWLAARKSGLLRLTPRSNRTDSGYVIKQFIRSGRGGAAHAMDNVYAACPDNRGRIWTASLDTGLGFINDTKDKTDGAITNCTHMAGNANGVTLNQRFRSFMPLSHDKWLVGADQGLFYINPLSWDKDRKGEWGKISLNRKNKKNEKELSVQYLLSGSDGNIYGATSGDGLLEMKFKEDGENINTTLYTKEDGMMQSDVIYTLVNGNGGDVWGFSDNGLFRIPRQATDNHGSHNTLPRTIACFSQDDTSPWPQMTIGNALALSDGRIIKGTRNGILVFNADSITKRRAHKRLYIRIRYRLNGETHDCLTGDTIRLPNGVGECSMYMSLTDYNRLTDTRYAIMVGRGGREWEYVTTDTFLIKDINDGETQITIRTTDSAGSWTDNGRLITIIREGDRKAGWIITALAVIVAGMAAAVWHRKSARQRIIRTDAVDGITDGIPSQQERNEIFKRKAEQMIVQNISETDYNTESLARDMGMTKTVVVSGIKTLYGIAPTELINRIRIQAAEEMLAKTDLTISEIAYRTGFNDPKYFSRVYKRFAGCTPSETRSYNRGR